MRPARTSSIAGWYFAAPGVGEGGPIELVAERRQQPLCLARDARAPIDERAEDIEEKRFHRPPRQFFCFIELRYSSSPAFLKAGRTIAFSSAVRNDAS